MRGGDALRRSMFMLLRGDGILDTNYSCACATPHLRRRVHLKLEDNVKTEQDPGEEPAEQK